jgi:DNA mismatch repair protein MutL
MPVGRSSDDAPTGPRAGVPAVDAPALLTGRSGPHAGVTVGLAFAETQRATGLPELGPRPDPAALPLGRLRPLGFVGARLLVCAAADGLVGVDVPTARRLLAYDRLRRGAPPIPLAAPVTLALTTDEARRFAGRREALRAAGADLEPFGGQTLAVKALPAGVAEADTDAFVRAALRPDGPTDDDGVRLLAADLAAASEGELTPPSAPAFLAALAGVRHAPPRPAPYVLALTLAELDRRLVAGPAA